MTTIHPTLPSRPYGGTPLPVWAVIRDGVRLGEIRQEADPPAVRYGWRVTGMPWFAETRTGAWWEAQMMVEHYADKPSGYRRDSMPESGDG